MGGVYKSAVERLKEQIHPHAVIDTNDVLDLIDEAFVDCVEKEGE